MKPLGEILGGVEQQQKDAQAEINAAKKEARKEINVARQQILAGQEVTDSKLHDGVIGLYGSEIIGSPKIIQRYERVNGELAGQIGEPVVIIQRKVETSGCSGFGGELDYSVDSHLIMGVISGEELVFDLSDVEIQEHQLESGQKFEITRGGKAFLPTSAYASGSYHLSADIKPVESMIEVDQGGIDGIFDHSITLGNDLDRVISASELGKADPWGHHAQTGPKRLEILVGRANINDWLTQDSNSMYGKSSELRDMRKLSEVLGIEPIAPATDFQKAWLRIEA